MVRVTLPTIPEPDEESIGNYGIRCDNYSSDLMESYGLACYYAGKSSESLVVPDGWQLVPKEPTKEMVLVGEFAMDVALTTRVDDSERLPYPEETVDKPIVARSAYKAMLAAVVR